MADRHKAPLPGVGARILVLTPLLRCLVEGRVVEVSPSGDHYKLEWEPMQYNGMGEYHWLSAAEFKKQLVEELTHG